MTTRIPWDEVPETFQPDASKPWRVVSGFGYFQDFATAEEALEYHEDLLAQETRAGGGWEKLVQEPFNTAAKGGKR